MKIAIYGSNFKFNFLQISQKPPEFIYWQDERNRSAAVFSLLAQTALPLNLNILSNCRFSKFFWNCVHFLFFFYQKCAILPTVIILKKRKWILYPYSIFHAKIWASFIFVLSVIPPLKSWTQLCNVEPKQVSSCLLLLRDYR